MPDMKMRGEVQQTAYGTTRAGRRFFNPQWCTVSKEEEVRTGVGPAVQVR